MSFQRPAAKPSTVEPEIQQLKTSVEELSRLDVSDPAQPRTFGRKVKELRARADQIEAKLGLDPKGAQLRAELDRLRSAIDRAAEDVQARIEQSQKPAAVAQLPPDATEQQLQLAQEQGEHVEFLQTRVQSIAEDTKVPNELTHEVHDVRQRDHEKIVPIDAVVAEAHENMVEGSAGLAEAEEHQKKPAKLPDLSQEAHFIPQQITARQRFAMSED
jgi:chromosome segregation ATPase